MTVICWRDSSPSQGGSGPKALPIRQSSQPRLHIYNFQCGYIGSLETGKKKETLCQSTEDHEKQMKRFFLSAQLLIVEEAMQII